VSKLRGKFVRDMRVRGLAVSTRETYLDVLDHFTSYLQCSPAKAGLEQVEQFLVDSVVMPGHSANYFNVCSSALRFFYRNTLQEEQLARQLPRQKVPRVFPSVPTPEEIRALLQAAKTLKHRAILATLYATGLRRGEVARLKVEDIDSQRMFLRVSRGKGGKDRNVMLSPRLLKLLRNYYREYWPKTWLFFGLRRKRHISPHTLGVIIAKTRERAGIKKRISCHSLRHAFAVHLLDQGVDLRKIQLLLGHRWISTTTIYLHISGHQLIGTKSPFDSLPL
jgi:site-specific recombinase XerD